MGFTIQNIANTTSKLLSSDLFFVVVNEDDNKLPVLQEYIFSFTLFLFLK